MIAAASLVLLSLTPNPAVAMPQHNDLFSSTTVSQITIRLSNANAQKLVSAPKDEVSARFNMTNKGSGGGFKVSNIPVRFNLKGTSTLRQNPSLTANRPSMRVKFNLEGPLNLGFLGTMKSLTLNAMTQDESKIHEYSAYKLYNAMGVPAPRVGYAKVKVIIGNVTYNKGLFAVIEPYDDVFLENRFDSPTQHLYEPCKHWIDVTRAGAAKGGKDCDTGVFEVKEGWKKAPNKKDLQALANVQKIKKNSSWWKAMDRYTERDSLIRMWAVDNFISAWDSYSGAIINNYYLRSDAYGVFTMMPTGADETFVYNFPMDARSIGYPLIYTDFQIESKGRGYMFSRCLVYKPCRNDYLDALKETKKVASDIDLVGQMKAISKTLNGESTWAQRATQNWVGMKSREVDALLRKYGR